MTKAALALVALALAALWSSGCRTSVAESSAKKLNRQAEATGSPYRYRAYRVAGGSAIEKYRAAAPTPGPIPDDLQPTAAIRELQRDVLARISTIQQGWGNNATPALLGVKPLGMTAGTIRETWFVQQDDGSVRYEVTMTPSSQGGTKFLVNGPLD